MAAPPEVTITNLSGKWVMNKTLSDDVDAMLTLQGLSWFTRKAISLATVVLTIKEYVQDSVFHIDITSVASGLSTTQEDRTLDWTEREHVDRIFGKVNGKSRWWKAGEFEKLTPGGEEVAVFLRAEKLKDGTTDSRFLDDEHVQSWAKNVDSGGGWTAEQNWGFEEIDGKRYYTRRVVVEKGGKLEMARLVYNYTGKVDKKNDEDDQDLAYGEE